MLKPNTINALPTDFVAGEHQSSAICAFSYEFTKYCEKVCVAAAWTNMTPLINSAIITVIEKRTDIRTETLSSHLTWIRLSYVTDFVAFGSIFLTANLNAFLKRCFVR
ncbi:hypothetical protein [Alicyclobacillus mengziensis]|uniref:Uncharacterized protein n=1 Tax=Alicyclobacillus mengziensis TaxID=2931921 RepID=A0A9X7VXV1_9BACL|nr:hypothetical protein [Alicyclobacillus mengziensis]QSO46590.1 hypothetical protein JZ786_19355 [Alicyclobacillus mengziensis]